jgi:hypothetical protein
MNFAHRSVIENTSAGAMKHTPIDGMVDSALLLPSQRRAVDGLITDTSTRSGMSMKEPIRAEGSYVGAPTMPVGHKMKAYAPKTHSPAGHRMPVGQN